jgi:hypothetical protein
MNTFLSPQGPAYEEGEDEISPPQHSRVLGEHDTNVPIDERDDGEEDGDEMYFPTARAKKEARKGKGKAAAPVKVKTKGKGKGKGKAKAKATPKAKAASTTPTPKIRPSALPRTTIRGEARTILSANATPSGSNATLTPYAPAGNILLGPCEHDSHINTSNFPGLKNVLWPLMSLPPGSHLDVNNLLILHPPALSQSDDTHVPVNQYNRQAEDKGQSKFEMYTCRACRKTYDGKNARSVARRHLQDKHGIPLSQQARRTRWDIGEFSLDLVVWSVLINRGE